MKIRESKVKMSNDSSLEQSMVAIDVKPNSTDEKWFMSTIPEKLKDGFICRLGVLFGNPDNTYLITESDYKNIQALIEKRISKKEFAIFTAELVGSAVGAIAMYYICETIKNHG